MKKTKGKQKIETKKIESNGDRMITFSKRRSGIYKKLNEIVMTFNADATFLTFSKAGNPYTFSRSPVEKMFERLMNPLRHQPFAQEDATASLVEAHKKQNSMDLMAKYMKVVEDLDVEKEKEKVSKESRFEKMWWNRSLEGMSMDELDIRHQAFVDLYDILCDVAISRLRIDGVGKEGEGSSSRRE